MAIATVSAAGLAIAMVAGNAAMAAASRRRSGTNAASVTTPSQVPVASVTINPASTSLSIGATGQLRATPKDSAGNVLIRLTNWASSDTVVATVSVNGLISAISAGSTTITATAGGKSGTVRVTVSAAAPPTPPRGTFLTPDILNNASFETGEGAHRADGWSDFTNFSAGTPSGGARGNTLTRDTTFGYSGTSSVKRHLPMQNNPSGNGLGAALAFPFSYGPGSPWYMPVNPGQTRGVDRLFARFYFYFDAAINGTFKLQLIQGVGFSGSSSGVYTHAGKLAWIFGTEDHTYFCDLAPLSSLVNRWHSIEYDYWRNGDTSNGGHDYPSVAIWIDGVQVTRSISVLPAPAKWINGRINAGERGSTARLGTFNLLGILNEAPANTIAGNVWIDRVSISTRGRVGP